MSKTKKADGESRKTASKPAALEQVRDEIDTLDRQILELLSQRRERSLDAARAKQGEAQRFRDPKRESALLVNRIQKGKEYGLDSHFVTNVFQGILADSLRVQREYFQDRANDETKAVRVAFQGIEGSYSHLAAQKYFAQKADRVSYLGCSEFTDVVETVEKGGADLAMLPIENTTSGGINEVYDVLLHAQLAIVGEVKLKVRHCLLGLESADLSEIQTIYCHPQTVLQCSHFVASLSHCELVYFTDTALSGKKIKDDGDPTQAAIASAEAARIFGLSVLKEGIANREENYTRFLVAARKPIQVDARIPCKTSIVMATGNAPGSLLEALLIFRDNGINLTKLESRPIIENPWEEMFYVDFEGNLEDARTAKAIDELTRKARFIKVLGCYPSQDLPAARVLPEQVSTAVSPMPQAPPSTTPSKRSAPAGYRLASREYKDEDTVIEVRGARIGGDDFVVIAGPCAVESLEQIMSCARQVKEAGGHILRGGCFKPRTSPYSFQGLGYEGLSMLVEAGRKYDLPVVTEVLSPEDVHKVAETADILQIGARNMQNFSLLSEVGRSRRPVMLKRGMSSSLDELLHAAEYILAGGNQQVFLCERGIRTFETATRNTLDVSAVPVLRERSHLPVIVDPSHAAGRRELVAPLALAGRSVGAHAVMVEIHPEPEKALSDGPQALRFPQFEELMQRLYR